MMKLSLIVLFCFIVSYPQNNNNKSFSLSLTAGTAFNNPINYYFYQEDKDVLINPGIYTNVAIDYGPINIVELSQLYFSVSVGYTRVSTDEIHLRVVPSSKAKLTIETFPILFWCRFQTNTRLSPFIEIGIGVSRLNYLEKYSYIVKSTILSYWALGYGWGAGLSYRICPDYNLTLGMHNLTNEKDSQVENNRYHTSGIVIRNSVITIDMRLNIYF